MIHYYLSKLFHVLIYVQFWLGWSSRQFSTAYFLQLNFIMDQVCLANLVLSIRFTLLRVQVFGNQEIFMSIIKQESV